MLTYEQRLELLKKARQAKKDKRAAKLSNEFLQETNEDNNEFSTSSVTEIPKKKTRKPKPKPEPVRSLDIQPTPMPDFVDSEPEIEEQIIYKPKDKKKKKIIRKVIVEASSDDEEIEEVVEHVKAPKKKVREHAPERKSESETPKASFFNF